MFTHFTSAIRKPAATDSPCTLIVEWTEGAEKRGRHEPHVLVDGQLVGQVDHPIRIAPGDHRIQVKRRRGSTPVLPCSVRAGETLVLEYEFSELPLMHQASLLAVAAAVWFSLQWIANVVAPLADRDALKTVFAVATFAALAGADWLLSPYFTGGTLQLADLESRPTTENEARDVGEAIGSAKHPAGRLLVHLVVAPINFIVKLPPPSPKVFVDGRAMGAVADPIRLRVGERQVHIRGWFEHSDPISIYVREGQLVELDAKRTSSGIVALIATALPFATAILTIMTFHLIDQALWIMLGGAAASLVCMLALSRLSPTFELEYRSD